MISLLSICGTPVEGGSTEVLLRAVAESFKQNLPTAGLVDETFVRLNEFKYMLCQACGKAPTPEYCFYEDDLTGIYEKLVNCDCLLFGSPIYFDSVSGQAKGFIDRCNCLRPADFRHTQSDHDFIQLIKRSRPGGMVLVGGKNGWFEGARRCIAGFFKWIEVINEGVVSYRSDDFNQIGGAATDEEALDRAKQLGFRLAKAIGESYVQR